MLVAVIWIVLLLYFCTVVKMVLNKKWIKNTADEMCDVSAGLKKFKFFGCILFKQVLVNY